MSGKARRVQITERQQKVLLEFSRSRSEAKALSQWAQIILAAFDRRLNEHIASKVGLNRKHVGRWRLRWQDAWEEVTRLECMEPPKLKAAIRETLSDAPRSGSPGKFSAAQVCGILAVACEPPGNSGRPISQWTREELRDEVITRGLVENISGCQISRYLRDAYLQPHRRKMWINTKEKDPPPSNNRKPMPRNSDQISVARLKPTASVSRRDCPVLRRLMLAAVRATSAKGAAPTNSIGHMGSMGVDTNSHPTSRSPIRRPKKPTMNAMIASVATTAVGPVPER